VCNVLKNYSDMSEMVKKTSKF